MSTQQKPGTNVSLDRAVSRVFYEFGLIEPAKPQMGMVNIPSAIPATFTEKITQVLNHYSISINEALTGEITQIETTIAQGNRKAILPKSPGSYGQEFMKILQPQLAQA